jgi:hypothetical protein
MERFSKRFHQENLTEGRLSKVELELTSFDQSLFTQQGTANRTEPSPSVSVP